jgi:preprotein translocase subunit Sss1
LQWENQIEREVAATTKTRRYFQELREGWNRIVSVSRKPDREEFNFNLRITLLALAVIGITSYLIQLALSFLFG